MTNKGVSSDDSLNFRYPEWATVEEKLEGIAARAFGPAKTVADCFKYRNKIGLEVALEALRDCYRQRKAAMDELFMAAKICRVARLMQPYLESLAAYYSLHLDRRL